MFPKSNKIILVDPAKIALIWFPSNLLHLWGPRHQGRAGHDQQIGFIQFRQLFKKPGSSRSWDPSRSPHWLGCSHPSHFSDREMVMVRLKGNTTGPEKRLC